MHCSKTVNAVRLDRELTEWFRITLGVRQGSNLSPYLFNLILEAMIRKALETLEVGLGAHGVARVWPPGADVKFAALSSLEILEILLNPTVSLHFFALHNGSFLNAKKTNTNFLSRIGLQVGLQQALCCYLGDSVQLKACSSRTHAKAAIITHAISQLQASNFNFHFRFAERQTVTITFITQQSQYALVLFCRAHLC